MFARIYTGSDGQSHFEDVEMESGPLAWFNQQSATGCQFRYRESGNFQDWHPAPQRQYVIVLSGLMEVKTGDGETRQFGAGDVMLADDLTGQGHTTGAVGGEPWVYATVQLD